MLSRVTAKMPGSLTYKLYKLAPGSYDLMRGPFSPHPKNVLNLMDALRLSMELERAAVAKPPSRRTASKPAKGSWSARGQTAT